MRTENVSIFSGTVDTDGNTYSTPINVENKAEVVLFLDVTEATGNDELTVYIMTKDPIGGKWFLLGNFDKLKDVGTDITYIINGLGSSIACRWEATGSFTFSLNASMKD